LTAVASVADADVAVVGIAMNAVRTLAESPGIVNWTVTPIMSILVMSATIVTLEVCAKLSAEAVVTRARVVAVHVAFHAVRALTESSDVMSRTVAPIMTVFVMRATIVALEVGAELSAEAVVTGTRVIGVYVAFYTVRALAEVPRVMGRTVAPIMAVFVMRAAIITLEVRAELSAVPIVTCTCVVGVHVAFYTIRTLAEVPGVMGRTVAPIMAVFVMRAAIVTLEVRAELSAVPIVTCTCVVGVHVSFDTVRALTIEARIMGGAVAVFAVLYRRSSIVTHC
jgi:hypothetical protein